MSKLIETGNKFRNFSVYVICIFMLGIMGFLAVNSMLSSTFVEPHKSLIFEDIFFVKDNILLNIISLLIGSVLVYLLSKVIIKVPLKIIQLVLFIWFTFIGFWWVMSVLTPSIADAFQVTSIAQMFSQGEYDLEEKFSSYINQYPFQLGFISFCQLIISLLHISDISNSLYFQLLNNIMLAFTMCIIVQTVKITVSEKAAKTTSVFCIAAIQPLLFCTLAYGNIPSLFFACLAVYTMFLFMQKQKWYFGVISALSIGYSVCLKINSYIVLIAMVIIICFDFFKTRKELIKKLLYVVTCVICSVGILQGVIMFYDTKTDVDLSSGIPGFCWLAMGISESNRAEGWYNPEYSYNLYMDNDKNTEKTTEDAKQIIKERIDYFVQNPSYAMKFFYNKTLSQWNAPTYQSMWINTLAEPFAKRGKLGSFVTGYGKDLTISYMNAYQQLVYAFTFVGIFFCLRDKNQKLCIFALIVLGGFLYHMFFEAKALYSMTYFVLMLPLAAYGFENVFSFVEKKVMPVLSKAKNKKKERANAV